MVQSVPGQRSCAGAAIEVLALTHRFVNMACDRSFTLADACLELRCANASVAVASGPADGVKLGLRLDQPEPADELRGILELACGAELCTKRIDLRRREALAMELDSETFAPRTASPDRLNDLVYPDFIVSIGFAVLHMKDRTALGVGQLKQASHKIEFLGGISGHAQRLNLRRPDCLKGCEVVDIFRFGDDEHFEVGLDETLAHADEARRVFFERKRKWARRSASSKHDGDWRRCKAALPAWKASAPPRRRRRWPLRLVVPVDSR